MVATSEELTREKTQIAITVHPKGVYGRLYHPIQARFMETVCTVIRLEVSVLNTR